MLFVSFSGFVSIYSMKKALKTECLFINRFFYIGFLIQIILDSYAAVRNNTEQSPVYFAQFPPVVIFRKPQ